MRSDGGRIRQISPPSSAGRSQREPHLRGHVWCHGPRRRAVQARPLVFPGWLFTPGGTGLLRPWAVSAFAISCVVCSQPRRVDRRFRAAARSRCRWRSSPSQSPIAAARAAGSPGGISWPGRVPSAAGAERFGQPTDGGGYDGQAVGERFGDGHAVGLRAGRRDEQVGGGVRVAERRAGQDAGEPNAVAVAEASDSGLQLVDEVRVAVERSGQHAMPVQVSELGECLDEEVLPLVAAEEFRRRSGDRGRAGPGQRPDRRRAGRRAPGGPGSRIGSGPAGGSIRW